MQFENLEVWKESMDLAESVYKTFNLIKTRKERFN
jgi:hypothetical protein